MLKLTKHCKTQQKIRLFGIINAMFFDKTGPRLSTRASDTKMTERMLKKSGAFHSTTCITTRCMGGTKSTEETQTKQINLR